MVSVADVADRLGVEQSTIRHWIRSGVLQGRKVGGRLLVYEKSVLDAVAAGES